MIGDIGNTFWQLYESELDASMRDFDSLYTASKEAKQLISDHCQDDYQLEQIGPRRLAKELRDLMQPKDILALDNGLYKVRLARNYPAAHPNTILLDNALATMGAGISVATVAKMLSPEQQVVAVVGDGGLMMNLGDLETAVRLGNPLTIIVLNDHAYGMIKRKQQKMSLTDYGLDLHNPDFQQLAEAFGANHFLVDQAEKFVDILTQSRTLEGVTIIEVPFVYPDTIS